jgi:hypothetical protein
LPGNARFEHEDDAGEGGAVRDPWAATLGLGRFLRQERFDGFPEIVWDQGCLLHEPDNATPAWY